MYQQQQSYQTANYRGNQSGHDQYLRSDAQQPSTFGTPVTSQYRGASQKSFQPTGQVQSFYGNQTQNIQSSFQNRSFGQQQFSNAVSPQSYHTANYVGHQAGHDQYLRGDSGQPSNIHASASSIGQLNQGFSGYGQTSYQAQSPQSFHAAHYVGNQIGHDQQLRGDSAQPSNIHASAASQSAWGQGISQFGGQFSNQGQFANQSQFSNQSPQSFHMAHYRGNQPGHDQQLRADATRPSQSQFGGGIPTGQSFAAQPLSNQAGAFHSNQWGH